MATTWGLRPTGIKTGAGPESITLPYVLTGVSDPTIARILAVAYSSAMYGNLYRTSVQCDELGGGLWNVDVTYGSQEKKQPEAGDFRWTFDTTGKTKHLTQGLAHISEYVPDGETAIKFGGALNATDDDVQGVDVADKAFKWTETHQLLLAEYGFTYATILGEHTGKMNDGEFRGFPQYTVQFGGASGGQSAKDPLLLEGTFNFEVSPDVTGMTVGIEGEPGYITGITKAGWDYLWVYYEKQADDTAKKVRPVPRQVCVDRVLGTFDFSLLGIGTT